MKQLIFGFIGIVVAMVCFSNIGAQNADIGNHCPAIIYTGSRLEWEHSFQTNGEAGRVVFNKGTTQVHVEDWCQTYGQGLIPPFIVQLLKEYRFTPNPKTGDLVTSIVSVNWESGKITAKSLFNEVKRLPPLSSGMKYVLIDINNSGSPINLALFSADGIPEQYLQTPDGQMWQVSN